MAENLENINTPHEETNHHSRKEPMGSRRSTNLQYRRTTRSRRAQPEGGPSAQTTSAQRTQPDVGPSMQTMCSRRTQRGNRQNPRARNEELNRGGSQSLGERTYEMESHRLRRHLKEAQHRNIELEREAASAWATQGMNAQNQPEPGVRRPRGRPRGSRTRRQEKAWEEQLGENETPPENQDEQPERRQPETDEREIPPENEEYLGTQPGEQRSPARNHQRSSQTHRVRTRTYPDEGNMTNRSQEERTEREEASVTSRQFRTHSR
ncbi:uncharacterized protein LOC133034456 [Cannabis sativa]|uniref:uncharacterized protein LOC133034456 n=1 Tax=Cannabis sativa TaxID=3483 RepID=UPI0029CA0C91|nr:uncharacterized protein LOC133034456 [Cannabis sativa]